MKNKLLSSNLLIITVAIMLASLARLLPHPPNFTPIAAMALFGGAYYLNKKLAFVIPFIAMFFSDFILMNTLYAGTTTTFSYFTSLSTIAVYISFALIVLIGLGLRKNKKAVPLLLSAITSSVLFFIVTNFAVWAGGMMYPHNLSGLITCYVAALPFFNNHLLGDLFFVAILFGGFFLVQLKFPVLARTNATL